MNGNVMYEIAMLRVADQHRLAEQRRFARAAVKARKQARAAQRRNAEAGVTALPTIPDFAGELLAATARDTVPAQRLEADSGRALPGR